MIDRSRRRLLQTSAAVGLSGVIRQSIGTADAISSPDLEKYVQRLPIPMVRAPDGKRMGTDYYEIPVVEISQQLHPDLPPTTLWGFDGTFPGPIIQARQNQRLMVRFDNSTLPTGHLLEIDDRIHGTKPEDYPDYDGPVPEVRTVTHFHGLNIEPESDGQSEMWKSPGGITGPRFSKHVHDIPNQQSRLTSTYHDHALGITRLNVYAGLVGFYFIRSGKEDQLGLPTGEYDIPLMLQDRSFTDDGELRYPNSFEPNVAGDTAIVNGAVWPYLEVEPSQYRLRFVNGSNGRTFDLQLENTSEGDVPALHQFAAGHGFLDQMVEIGPEGDLGSLLLTPFERGDVVVDFSDHAGEMFTVTNGAKFPFGGRGDAQRRRGDGSSDLGELMQIRVSDSSDKPPDEGDNLREMDLPDSSDVDKGRVTQTRRLSLNVFRDKYGLDNHVLNNRRFDDETVIKPQLGTAEIWELRNATRHTHPIHLHLIEFEVLGRGPAGTEEPDPNERVGKDTVRVDPGETVRILIQFSDFAGRYPWHCHILEHEDHEMMRPFEVVKEDSGGERTTQG